MIVIRLSMMMNQFLHCCPSLDGIIGVDFRCGGCGGCGVYGVGDDDESLFVFPPKADDKCYTWALRPGFKT